MKLARAALTAAGLALLCAAALSADGEKIDLRRAAAVGDRLRVVQSESKQDDVSQTLAMTVEGRTETKKSVQHGSVTILTEFRDEVRGTEGDRTMRVRREFVKVEVKAERKSVEDGKETGPTKEDAPEGVLHGLEGKTFDLVRVAGITGVGGKDAQGLSPALKDMIDIDLLHVHLLPDRPVAAGESWTVSEDGLRRLLTPGSSGRILTDLAGTLTGKLEMIEVVEGRRWAKVRFRGTLKFSCDPSRGEESGEASAAAGQTIPGGMEVTGELAVGLDGARETKLSMRVQVAILGDLSPDEQASLSMDVKAGIVVEEAAIWEKE